MTKIHGLIALTFGARIVSALLALAMALIVVPDVFGFYGRLQAIGLVFTVFAVFRLERAIVTAHRLSEAVRVTRAALLILPATSATAVLAAFALSPDLSGQQPQYALAVLLFAAFGARGLLVLVNAWLLRSGDQARLGGLVLTQATAQFAAQAMLLATGWPTLSMLVAGEIVGAIVAAALVSVSGRAPLALLMKPRWSTGLLARWHRLVLFNLPAALASQTLVALPLITVGRIADHATTGHIALALRIADAPMLLLASASTSFIIAAGAWRRGSPTISNLPLTWLYLGAILLFGCLLVGAAWSVGLLAVEGRIAATATYIPVVTLLSGALALGGPYAEIVAFAGAERRAFSIHLAALIAGLIVFQTAAKPEDALLHFGLIAAVRSLALCLIFPRALKTGADKQV